MEIPIVVNARTIGQLEIRREGAYTCFDGRCEDTGELLRLSVYGGGKEGVLGVMAPEKGALALHRRLSRAALRGFPETPEYAAPAGQGGGAANEAQREEPRQEEPRKASSPAAPEQAAEGKPGSGAEKGTDLLWYATGDGSLITTWQGKRYRAIPMAAHGLSREGMVEQRRIEGVDYAVYEFPERSRGQGK